jgi:hypothetical protein
MSCGYYWCWGRLRRNRLGILLQIGAASRTDGERNDKRPSYAFPVAHSSHCVAILFPALHLFFLLMLVCILLLRVGGFLFWSSTVCTIFVLNLICGFPSVLYIYIAGSILKRERCCCSCDAFQWKRVSKSFCWIQYLIEYPIYKIKIFSLCPDSRSLTRAGKTFYFPLSPGFSFSLRAFLICSHVLFSELKCLQGWRILNSCKSSGFRSF